MRLLTIDGNSILNRAYYGIRLLSNSKGQYTNAILGFINIYLKTIEEVQPDHVAIAFDLPAPTFRHKAYSEYKAQRKGMPDELAMQMQPLKELLTYLGITIVEKKGMRPMILSVLLLQLAPIVGANAMLLRAIEIASN